MLDPLAWLDEENIDRKGLGLHRKLRPIAPSGPGRVEFEGKILVDFASNDYLGLARDPRVVEAAKEAADRFGFGAGASPLVSGWTTIHEDLARELAEFEGTEAALLFPTGFAANLGAITSLVAPGDAVYGDRLNHACLIDGARLSGASLRVYPHNDVDRLSAILERDAGRFRRRLIATDGVFSMDGDLAPLADLADLADRSGSILLVDEAHGTGVFGPEGRGAASEFGVEDRVHVRVGTLSKALGSIGGFVAGPRRLIDHLINRARPAIYSTSLPPAAVAAAREALRIARSEPWRRQSIRALGDRLRGRLVAAGIEVGGSTGPIVPVVLGDPGRSVSLADRLLDRGALVAAIRPPTVPKGTSRLRIVVGAAHGAGDVDALVEAIGAP